LRRGTNVQKTPRCGFSKSKSGFTYIEMMVALIILSLVGVLVWQGISASGKLLDKISVSSSTTMRLMQTEESVRELVGKIRIPFWINAMELEEGEGEIAVPFYEGRGENLLIIKYEDGSLIIGNRGTDEEQMHGVKSFGPFSNAEIGVARSEEGELFGITVVLYPVKSPLKPLYITARFGSNPIWAEDLS
jgi:prepilin-type N-terminal cleavage/methylation domain-containing protein